MLRNIDRFGVQAIMDRPTLYFGEIRRMAAAENIESAYLSRKASGDDWAKWAQEHPELEKILIEVEIMELE